MHQQAGALIVLAVGLLVAVRLLILVPRIRHGAVRLLERLGRYLLERLNPPEEVDELAVELLRAIRIERLRSDVRRLQRILVSDMSMSATRQLGNRLAYDWLVRELDEATRDVPWFLSDDRFASEAALAAPSRTRDVLRNAYAPRGPQVEVLELGGRR